MAVGYSLKVVRRVKIIKILYPICTPMIKDKSLKIRLDSEEYAKLQAYAELKKVSMAHILREYVRRLPNPKDPVRH